MVVVQTDAAAEWLTTQARRSLEFAADHSQKAAEFQLKTKLKGVSVESRIHASLGPGRVAVDVGAHVGMISALYAANFETVWAIEPNPRHATRLQHVVSAPELSNVVVAPLAIGAVAGTATLSIPRHHGRAVGSLGSLQVPDNVADVEQVTVPVIRLDDLIPGPIDVLKIDAEGFEVDVLTGAARLLSTKPIVIVESEERHRPGAPAQVRAILESHGLVGLMVVGTEVLPVSAFDATVHQSARPSLLGEVPDGYVNNFIYVPESEEVMWVDRLRELASF